MNRTPAQGELFAEETAPTFLEETCSHPLFGSYSRNTGEFWTARQRQKHSLHYIISYRASYKPELPEFFIERFSRPGETVLDPFGGRGTTALQAALQGRRPLSTDINPLHERIVSPKLHPVHLNVVRDRLAEIDFSAADAEPSLPMFYHPDTERQMLALRAHLRRHREPVDRFIELLALSRLHGHSRGFFSVYSFPQISVPKQAQERINKERRQAPEYRDVPDLILRKAQRVLRDGEIETIRAHGAAARVLTADARTLGEIPDNSVDLIVTSPPFLNKADYLADNWLEFWFCDIDPRAFEKSLVMTSKLETWKSFIADCMAAMWRVLGPDCHAVIEVGEVRDGARLIHLDEVLVDIAASLQTRGVRLVPEAVYIHTQNFTKLANCFRVDNNRKGTNTNRMVVFRAQK